MDNNKKHNEELSDQMIQRLFDDFSLDEVPPSLKSATMNRVFSDWAENANAYKPLINRNNRWWILGGFAALLATSFLIDATEIIDFWNQINSNNSLINLPQLFNSMGQIGKTMQSLPSIVYFTLAGLLALLALDRLFNRLANI